MSTIENVSSRDLQQPEPAATEAVSNAEVRSRSPSPGESSEKPTKTTYPTSFWLAFAGLCCTGLISALDGSIVSTALPSIVAKLNGGDNYIWVVNIYFLTRYARHERDECSFSALIFL